MRNRTFGIIFYLKKSKTGNNGKAPIYARITVDGQRAELALKREIEPEKWNQVGESVKGTNEESRSINAQINLVRSKIHQAQLDLNGQGKEVTANSVKNTYLGVDENDKKLIELFRQHNDQVRALVGKDFAAGTLERYETVVRLLVLYLQWKYKTTDLSISKVDHEFIHNFHFWLKSVRNNNQNTAVKYIKNFKKIIRQALHNGWIAKDPFVNFPLKVKAVERGYLTMEELQRIIVKDFHNSRLNQVRDIFVFSCFTGLAYADVKKLTRDQILKNIQGENVIHTHRTKTDTKSIIPVLLPAQEIIDKYKDHPHCEIENRILPVLSNQKMNAYLKEIADIAGIDKNLTTHLARHTFATTVTLTQGVPMESVSKMLGHTNLKTTQIYSKIVDQKVENDMRALNKTFLTLTPSAQISSSNF